MSHGKVLDKQSLDFAARVLQNLPNLTGEEMQYLISNPAELKRRLLALKMESAMVGFTETALLRPVATQIVPARTKSFDPKRFYQNRKGLDVWDTFVDRLDLRSRKAVASTPERTYVSLELKQNVYDRDIRAELPEHHLSMLEDIAALIKAQWGGKEGILLNNGRANIFYVEGKNGEVFAVNVNWNADDREWNVNDWRLDENGEWNAGNQVLCPSHA